MIRESFPQHIPPIAEHVVIGLTQMNDIAQIVVLQLENN